MSGGLHVHPKDNEEIRKEIEEKIQDILDGNYEDLGGGDIRFLPIDALGEIIEYCENRRDQLGYLGISDHERGFKNA